MTSTQPTEGEERRGWCMRTLGLGEGVWRHMTHVALSTWGAVTRSRRSSRCVKCWRYAGSLAIGRLGAEVIEVIQVRDEAAER